MAMVFRVSGSLGGDAGLLGLAPMNGRYTGGVGWRFGELVGHKWPTYMGNSRLDYKSGINARPTAWMRCMGCWVCWRERCYILQKFLAAKLVSQAWPAPTER